MLNAELTNRLFTRNTMNNKKRRGQHNPSAPYQQLEPRRLMAADAAVYEPGLDPTISAIATAFVQFDPQDPTDSFDILTGWQNTVDEFVTLGFEEITFAVFRQVNNGILSGGPAKETVQSAVEYANANGLAVNILPLFETEFGWRGNYDPTGDVRDTFRTNYQQFISDLASIPGIDRFNIGSELNRMVENPDNQAFFTGLIQTARGVLDAAGNTDTRIGYAANFDALESEQNRILLTQPGLDFFGVSAYNSLIDATSADLVSGTGEISESTFQRLVDSWNGELDRITNFAASINLSLIIQEFGAVQQNFATVAPFAVNPGDFVDPSLPDRFAEDALEQRAAYESLITALNGRGDQIESVTFWTWEHQASRGRRTFDALGTTGVIERFAIWPTDGGGGEFLAQFASTRAPTSLRTPQLGTILGDQLQVTGSDLDDTIRIEQTSTSIILHVNSVIDVFPLSAINSVMVDALAGNDIVSITGDAEVMVTFNGGDGDDTLIGGQGDDVLNGGLGNDRLFAGDGDDQIDGGDGDDVLAGEAGDDLLIGGAGVDRLVGAEGNDQLFGNEGNDRLVGGAGDDQIDGGDGNDLIAGQDGNDLLIGGTGADRLMGDGGNDRLLGNDGDDRLVGGTGNDFLEGNAGDDWLLAVAGENELFGGDGDDQLLGGAGADVIHGGQGADQLFAGGGDDQLHGNEGDDVLFGSAGNDLLFGDAGNDRLFGGVGDDQLSGGQDDDFLVGHAGNDQIVGGDGDDQLWGLSGSDQLNGEAGNDQINGGGDDDLLDGGSGDDRIIGSFGNDRIYGREGNDEIFATAGENTIFGGEGNDLIIGGEQADTIFGENGVDRIFGRGGDDVLDAGDGGDAESGQTDLVAGQDGDDTIIGGGGMNLLFGGAGDDRIIGGENAENRLHGQSGNDQLTGGNLQDFITVGSGDDTVDARGGDDSVVADGGNNQIDAGTGNDTVHLSTSQENYEVTQSDVDSTKTLAELNAGNLTLVTVTQNVDVFNFAGTIVRTGTLSSLPVETPPNVVPVDND